MTDSLFWLQLAVGSSLIWKACAGLLLRDIQAVRSGSFAYWKLEQGFSPGFGRVVEWLQPRAYAVMAGCGVMLFLTNVSYIVAFAALMGLLCCMVEMFWRFRYNQMFLVLCCLCIVSILWPWGASYGLAVAEKATAFLLVSLYWGSAISKMQSRGFRSGASLRLMARGCIYAEERARMGQHPRRVYSMLGVVCRGAWSARFMAWSIVALEGALPILLFGPTEGIRSFGVTLGVGMHVVLLFLNPSRLAPFQVLCVACYPTLLGVAAVFWENVGI